MRYIGLDLHTNQMTICYLEDGEYSYETLAVTEIDTFKSRLLKTDELAIEATGNSSYVYRHCIDLVAKLVVVNTMQFKVITKSCKKTDKNDAKLLAEFLSKDMLPRARVKSILDDRLHSLVDSRNKFIELRTQLKNKIHNLLNRCGIKIKKTSLTSMKGLKRVLDHEVDELVKFELEQMVAEIESLNGRVDQFDSKIAEFGSKLPGFENVSSIKGIGTNTAVTLLSSIGDINDFADEKKLAAYFGLVPRVNNSNETVNHGRITKKGDALVRKSLLQCALIAIKYNRKLFGFYDKIKTKRGFAKAIVATARKLLTIVYYTLKNGWYFTDFVKNIREIRPIGKRNLGII
ncbi:MAG: transposase [Pseudomonadota bacterium]|nr:transposase [Pseudomonadota bacterium]